MSTQLTLLSSCIDDIPDPRFALSEPAGLAAVGGDLSAARLIRMYRSGFFPWFNEPDPILWWHPPERCVLWPHTVKISRSMRKFLRRCKWDIRINTAFNRVINRCASQRADKEGTWISTEIKQAYQILHKQGYAHSIEVWQQQTLVGGFYGLALGQVFFGESMFSDAENASKTALIYLCQHAHEFDIRLIDCQVKSQHLLSMGASCIERDDFSRHLRDFIRTLQTNRHLTAFGQPPQIPVD